MISYDTITYNTIAAVVVVDNDDTRRDVIVMLRDNDDTMTIKTTMKHTWTMFMVVLMAMAMLFNCLCMVVRLCSKNIRYLAHIEQGSTLLEFR